MSLEDVDLEAGILSDLQKLAAKFHLKELIIFGSRVMAFQRRRTTRRRMIFSPH